MSVLKGRKEIAKYLKVSEKTVERWIRDRDLPARLIGDCYLATTEGIEQWILGCKPGANDVVMDHALDLIILAGLEEHFERTETGRLTLKEGKSIKISEILTAIKLKSIISPGLKEEKEAIFDIFPEQEQ